MTASFMQVLKRGVVTEKSSALKELKNQVVFEVERTSTKLEIKNAVEKAFNVKVLHVNTMIVPGKVKKMGKFEGKQANWKKAVVTLKAGEKIEIMEGV
ncbi:MAG: 50S ribosomal protein L23 [Pseudomonadota bacterium]